MVDSYEEFELAEIPQEPDNDEGIRFSEKRPTKFLAPDICEKLSRLISKSFVTDDSKFREFSDFLDVKIEGGFSDSWKKYLVIIKNKMIKIYENATSKQPYLSINLDVVSCKVYVVTTSCLQIQPVGFGKSLLLKPINQGKIEELCIIVHFNLVRSVGYNVELTDLCKHSRKFWKRSYITRNQFFDICEHGDLMLFKTSSIGSFALRIASNSEYDHVGLLIRGKNQEIFLYECLGVGGVQLNNIEYFLDNE